MGENQCVKELSQKKKKNCLHQTPKSTQSKLTALESGVGNHTKQL